MAIVNYIIFLNTFLFLREYVDKTLVEADRKEAIGIAILVVVLIVSPVIIVLVKNAAATIQVSTLPLPTDHLVLIPLHPIALCT